MDNCVGLAPYGKDWAIVEGTTSKDVYSHEVGHSLKLTSKKTRDGDHHEEMEALGPNRAVPLMNPGTGGSRWIRQQDWKTANTEAAKSRYGH